MSIITINRGSYSRGKEVAEKLALKLGSECISRDILLEASDEFNIPELKLIRAIHDAPSLLDRLYVGKERYIASVRKEILGHFKKDNVIYHGLAGHFFVKGISHVIKVRIIADMEDRVRAALANSVRTGSSLRSELEDLLGTAWDAELEPFRYAGDGAPIRYLHRVG
mgnify:CR=1 FL=1